MHQTDPLADLRARFIARSRERVRSLRSLIEARAEAPTRQGDDSGHQPPAEAITRLAHQLAGAAGTFGYAALGEAAARLEDRARAAASDSGGFEASMLAPFLDTLEARMSELEALST